MPAKKTNEKKPSPHLRVRVTRDINVEDLVWPGEDLIEQLAEGDIIELVPAADLLCSEDEKRDIEVLYALLQASDLHGTERMRGAVKLLLQIFFNALEQKGLIKRP